MQVRLEHRAIGDIVGHLAQPVHVVRKGDQPRLAVLGPGTDHRLEGTPHQRGPQHFLEGADVR